MSSTKNTNKSTRNKQRLAIIKDCLHRLRFRKVESGSYCYGDDIDADIDKNDQVQKHLEIIEKKCRVCALGGLFLSAVGKFNDITVSDCDLGYYRNYNRDNDYVVRLGREETISHLSKYFTKCQMMLIESAFEGVYYAASYYPNIFEEGECYNEKKQKYYQKLCRKAIKFCEDIEDDKEKLRAILKNMLSNDGTFKP